MTVRSGELIDLITFQKKVRTYQGELLYETWVDDFQEWADGQRLAEQISKFRIHYRKGITPDTHRIIAFDSIWSITNVLPDARYTELAIECDWSAMIEVTHLKSPRREWIPGLPAVAIPATSEEDDEFMNPVITDLSFQVTYPQPGVILTGAILNDSIIVIQTGKLVTLQLDAEFILPPNLGEVLQIKIPPIYAAKLNGWFAGTCAYGIFPSTPPDPAPNKTCGMYINQPDWSLLFVWFNTTDPIVTVGGHIFISGQITYVLD